ncbi:hypothetical protein ACHAWF_014874 [Thalassiosira exigua]
MADNDDVAEANGGAAAEAAAEEPVHDDHGGHSLAYYQQNHPEEEGMDAGASAAYEASPYDGDGGVPPIPVIQHHGLHPAAEAAVAAELPVLVHDPHRHDPHAHRAHPQTDDDVTAQAAQAIAASASAYNVPPPAPVAAHDHHGAHAAHPHAYAVAVDRTVHHGHAAYVEHAHPNAGHGDHAAAAAAAHGATGIEYIATAASLAAPGEVAAAVPEGGYATDARGHPAYPQDHPPRPYPHPHQHHPHAAAHPEPPAGPRKRMDALLAEQRRAALDVASAEEAHRRASVRLAEARSRGDDADARVRSAAEELADDLLAEDTRWNAMYRKLATHRDECGHCNVARPLRERESGARGERGGSADGQGGPPSRKRKYSRRSSSSDDGDSRLRSLGTWVGQVRLDARRPPGHPERLEPYKVVALDRLGFEWEPRENYWTDMYEQLHRYLQESGGKMPPRYVKNIKFPLGQWCDTQLDNYRKFAAGRKGAYITQEKIDMLNAIGFVWDKRGQMWQENYERLKEFKKQYGHCNVTASNNGGDKSFGTWVTKQKRKYATWRRGDTKSRDLSLTDEQAALMDEIGFGESVGIDGRRIRSSGGMARAANINVVNAAIDARLANASPINVRPEDCPPDDYVEEKGENPDPSSDAEEAKMVEGDSRGEGNMDPSVGWGDSANAVSLLVDAIMNKENNAAAPETVDETDPPPNVHII